MSILPIGISDIAKLAGVSHTTVSRVLNRAPIRISQKKREEILEIAQRMNYVPNRSARALKLGRHGRIAVIAYDITDAFAVECIGAMEAVLASSRYHALWLSCAHADRNKVEPGQLLLEVAQSVDGLVIILSDRYLKDADILTLWSATHLPLVSVIRKIPGDVISSITIDNDWGSQSLLEHLYQLGHRRIGFLYCWPENPSASGRHQYYQVFLRQHQIPAERDLQIPVDGSAEGGYAAGLRLLDSPSRPTAIVGFNDLSAIGALKACFDRHIRVPLDISVAGYDDIRMARMVAPALTTVAANYEELARQAIEELIRQIERSGESGAPVLDFLSRPQLCIRQSTGPVRASVILP
jgi:DNA-binding LacI/PurR family transcriptional regulator